MTKKTDTSTAPTSWHETWGKWIVTLVISITALLLTLNVAVIGGAWSLGSSISSAGVRIENSTQQITEMKADLKVMKTDITAMKTDIATLEERTRP